ncbi:MAG: hypothetical protein ABEJ31_12215 [Haloarculaceae archaeon]
MDSTEDFIYVCPECAETIEVNGEMKDALIANGCVMCGADVTPGAFSPT